MAKVKYVKGSKSTYLALLTRDPYTLYFCEDTRELFKGDDLYTDGMRVVPTFASLPILALAADGVLYFCEDTGNGYVLNDTRDDWVPVIHGVDGSTITLNSDGLMQVGVVPMSSVAGLEERLTEIATQIVTGGVKGSDEVLVAEDGTLSIGAVEQVKITGLEDRLTAIEQSIVGGVHYRGSVATYDDLPVDAKQGDLYEVLADNSEWCWNGEDWFDYGHTTEIDLSGYVTRDEAEEMIQIAVDTAVESAVASVEECYTWADM